MLPKAPVLWWVGKMLGSLGPARTELIAKAFLELAVLMTGPSLITMRKQTL